MKTALITGASHGIGKAIAKKLARENCRLILNCHKSTGLLEDLCHQLESEFSTTVLPLAADVSRYEEVFSMFQTIQQRFGGIDFLINNAGKSQIGLLSDLTPQEWGSLMDTNLSSVFYCCKLAIPHMVAQQSGKIINISSVWGEVGASCEAAYAATKGGMNALTRSLAKELAPSHIQVNAIACGCIDTRMNSEFTPDERILLEEEIPLGRYGTPQEVAELVWSLLCSNEYLTGQVIRLDGGWI